MSIQKLEEPKINRDDTRRLQGYVDEYDCVPAWDMNYVSKAINHFISKTKYTSINLSNIAYKTYPVTTNRMIPKSVGGEDDLPEFLESYMTEIHILDHWDYVIGIYNFDHWLDRPMKVLYIAPDYLQNGKTS